MFILQINTIKTGIIVILLFLFYGHRFGRIHVNIFKLDTYKFRHEVEYGHLFWSRKKGKKRYNFLKKSIRFSDFCS